MGEDNWVAIAVLDDAEWRALVSAMANPEWTKDARFASQESRFANQDALDEHVSAWTRAQDRHAAMHTLQAAGVRAAAVQTMEDIVEHDPQIAHRGIYFELDHPVIGVGKFEGVPIKFSRTQTDNLRSAPLLGEDNEYVLKQIIGVSDDEFAELYAEEVI
jgi:crotonobetainyl-CoA:carnitine CoA-transferase CaiB-like acyl-CoA transferase